MTFQILTRAQWGAKPPKQPHKKMALPAPETWIHHTVVSFSGDEATDMRRLQEIAFARGFIDLSYSWVHFPTGVIGEGRGWGIVGGHTLGHNSKSHAFSFQGNFQVEVPTIEALNSCRWLISEGLKAGKIKPAAFHPTGGHRDTPEAATACPGNNLYRELTWLRTPWPDPIPEPDPEPSPIERTRAMYIGQPLNSAKTEWDIKVGRGPSQEVWVTILSEKKNSAGQIVPIAGEVLIESLDDGSPLKKLEFGPNTPANKLHHDFRITDAFGPGAARVFVSADGPFSLWADRD